MSEEDVEEKTLEGQFQFYASLFKSRCRGDTITLTGSDYWMRQAEVIDDRKLTMTDTGIHFFKFEKSELTWDEWLEYLSDLCHEKDIDEDWIKNALTNCEIPVLGRDNTPAYKNFFLDYKPKNKFGFL